jgi:2-haloacid dehalogenase
LTAPLTGIAACVFDAYGTLLDVRSATERLRVELGDRADRVAALWRMRQLEYSWLLSLMQRYEDFWQVTGDALDFALADVGIADTALRDRLLDQYRRLDAYPDVPAALAALRAAGLKTAILSNGSPAMLADGVDSAGFGDALDAVLSVDEAGIYKPHPTVYRLACDRLGMTPEQICFVSSNGWDVAGAACFGFQVVWLNRSHQTPERLPGRPRLELDGLDRLPALIAR